MSVATWTVLETLVENRLCGVACPRNRYALCEVPVRLHREDATNRITEHHGRDRYGKWWSWPCEDDEGERK